MAGIRIEGNISGNVAEVANNHLQVNSPSLNTRAGFVTSQYEVDAGFATAERYVDGPYVSKHKRLSAGLDTILAAFAFTNLSQDTNLFRHQFSTMTMTQSAGFLNINPTLATVATNYASLQTWRHFAMQGDFPIIAKANWSTSSLLPANQIFEWGWYVQTTGTVPLDGVFFRITNAGTTGVMTYGGVETETGILTAPISINVVYRYKIILDRHTASFWRNDILLAQLPVPAGDSVPFLSLSLPLCVHLRNPGTVVGGATFKLGTQEVTQKDAHTSKPWAHQMGTQGKAYQGQPGDTVGQLSIWANLASPTATVLTNSSGAFTGLGGLAQVTVTLAAATDGIIFSYQNPLGSTTVPPKTLVVTGVTISDVVSVVLPATALVYAYAIAYGHTAVSLATTESTSFATGTTKAPRRVAIGTTGYLASAAVGTQNATGPLTIALSTPIVVNPGEFFQIIAKALIAAPASGALVVTACVDHYFE
jgi:hypothetical protein